MRARFFLLALGAALAAPATGCDGDSEDEPTVSGITEVTLEGDVLRVDPDDWRLVGCANEAGGPGFAAYPARPNPTRDEARIVLTLDRPARVVVQLQDDREREIAVLVDEEFLADEYQVAIRREVGGRALPEGIYRVRIQIGERCRTYGDVRFIAGGGFEL